MLLVFFKLWDSLLLILHGQTAHDGKNSYQPLIRANTDPGTRWGSFECAVGAGITVQMR